MNLFFEFSGFSVGITRNYFLCATLQTVMRKQSGTPKVPVSPAFMTYTGWTSLRGYMTLPGPSVPGPPL